MNPRSAFKVFIRFQLRNAIENGVVELSDEEIETIANELEDDPDFYDQLNDFLADYINDRCL